MEDNNIENNELKEIKTNKGFGKGAVLGFIVGLLLVCFIYGCVMIVQLVHQYINNEPKNTLDKDTLKKMQNIQKIIDSNFYKYSDEVSADNIEEGIYKGMIDSLGDPYAEYYSVEDMQEVMDDVEGVKYGIGCYVTIDENDMPLIYGVQEDSPAEEAGVLTGDIIISVNGESVVGKSLSQVVELIKGLENTTVDITFNRDGELIELTVTRGAVIENTTVNYGLLIDNEDIGYIQIKEFEDVTVHQYQEAIENLNKENIKGLILDLRNNPGGNLNAVVDIAREILPEGLIVYTENNKGIRKEYSCDGEKELDLPLVVLVNKYSASASEILSGAIQDCNKGTIIGTTTYGKGIVQSLLQVGDGSLVKITTSAYFTPSGRYIQGVGIEPDIILEYDKELAEEGIDNQVDKAREILEGKIGE